MPSLALEDFHKIDFFRTYKMQEATRDPKILKPVTEAYKDLIIQGLRNHAVEIDKFHAKGARCAIFIDCMTKKTELLDCKEALRLVGHVRQMNDYIEKYKLSSQISLFLKNAFGQPNYTGYLAVQTWKIFGMTPSEWAVD
jgi:hypothetical protein